MVTVQELTDVYYVGDVINCTANGNPEPDYEWYPVNVPQMTGARIYNSPQLEVTKNLIGKLKCLFRTLMFNHASNFSHYRIPKFCFSNLHILTKIILLPEDN